jgi:nitroimidazol reductase NimA-like FMN-containing flavoprotein (pyridoxamine 5'-phosphate oxidase superfamily)
VGSQVTEQNVEQAREITHRIQYVTVATVSVDGKPWNSPVYSSFDNAGNIYWQSSSDSQHSRNVEANGQACLVIYDSTAPEGTGVGVYIEASVEVLDDIDEITEGLHHLSLRVGQPIEREPKRFAKGGARRVYRARPTRVWTNDAELSDDIVMRDYRVELPVETLAGLVTW